MSDGPHEGGGGGQGGALPPCKFCGAAFNSIGGMRNHKKKKLQEECGSTFVHLWCEVCDLDFSTFGGVDQHIRHFHPEKQDLICPGCGTHFVKLSGFVKHIELHECPTLDLETIEARRHKSVLMTKRLAELDHMSKESVRMTHEKNFYPYLGHDPNPITPWKPSDGNPSPWQAQDGWDEVDSVGPDDKDFPRLARQEYLHGNNKPPDFLTGYGMNPLDGKEDKNPWAKKGLFPNAPAAKKPSAEQVLRLEDDQRAAAERARGMNMDPADPNSPIFNAERFWVEYIKKYKCPRQPCKKSFAKKAALVQHLLSGAHKGTNACCPACFKYFDSLYALASHVESESQKCHMRWSKAYGWFLHQLTWGTAEVGGGYGDYMHKYQLQKEFQEDFGPQKTARPTYGHEQVYGSQGFGGSANPGNHPQITAGALPKQQQQGMMNSRKQPATYGHGHGQQKRQQQQQGGGGGAAAVVESVPLATEALSRLSLQEMQGGTTACVHDLDDSQGRPPSNVSGQPSGPPMAKQQTGGCWNQPPQPQKKQQQGGDAWPQYSGSGNQQHGGYGAHRGGQIPW